MGLGTRMGLPAVGGWRTALEGSVPLSPRTDAVFAELARDLAREEWAAIFVQACLGTARELRKRPHDRPASPRSSRDTVRTTELIHDVVPAAKDFLLQVRQGRRRRPIMVDELLHLTE